MGLKSPPPALEWLFFFLFKYDGLMRGNQRRKLLFWIFYVKKEKKTHFLYLNPL